MERYELLSVNEEEEDADHILEEQGCEEECCRITAMKVVQWCVIVGFMGWYQFWFPFIPFLEYGTGWKIFFLVVQGMQSVFASILFFGYGLGPSLYVLYVSASLVLYNTIDLASGHHLITYVVVQSLSLLVAFAILLFKPRPAINSHTNSVNEILVHTHEWLLCAASSSFYFIFPQMPHQYEGNDSNTFHYFILTVLGGAFLVLVGWYHRSFYTTNLSILSMCTLPLVYVFGFFLLLGSVLFTGFESSQDSDQEGPNYQQPVIGGSVYLLFGLLLFALVVVNLASSVMVISRLGYRSICEVGQGGGGVVDPQP